MNAPAHFSLSAPVTLRAERIAALLCCAFEGGSNYWYRNATAVLPSGEFRPAPTEPARGWRMSDFAEGGRGQVFDSYWHWTQVLPFVGDGAVEISTDDDPTPFRLDRGALERGLKLMAEKHPRHWADVVGDNADAETGDVFLQLCLFGEVVYG